MDISGLEELLGKTPDKALKNFLNSEEICKNSSDKTGKRAFAQAYYGLGALDYYDPEDYQAAKEYFERHLFIGIEINDTIIITSGYYTIGVQYQSLGRYEEAKKNLGKCLELSKEIELIYNKANAYEGLGDVYVDQNNYKKALDNYLESHKLFLETKNKFQVAEIKRRLGKLYNKMGEVYKIRENYKKAYGNLFLALEISQRVKIPKTTEGVCEEITKSCEKLGEYREESTYYRMLLEKKEFLRNNEMSIRKLIREYEKKAEKEKTTRISLIIGFIGLFIVLVVVSRNSIKLKKQKGKIEEQTEKLAATLKKEKEISDLKDDLMHTVSHQYKTPLAIIDSSTQILKDYLDKLTRGSVCRMTLIWNSG